MTDRGSPVRRLVEGATYQAYASLEGARGQADATVVLEGDFGGTIYLVAPVDGVRCDEATLSRLLSDIDQMCWRDLEMARVAIERRPVGSGVAGGMGGGRVQKTLWLHPELEALGVRREIEDILAGKPYRLDPSGRRWD